jgi:spore coat protein CotH
MSMRRFNVLSVAVLVLGIARLGPAADPIFDQSRLHEVRLVMDPDQWAALKRDFRLNNYYAANISLDGEVLQQVGIRSRGAGSRSGEKPGLKIDFNKYITTQEFHGYKTMVLDNGVQDASMLRERLAFAVFEGMGIPAPQIAHARLTVNDEYAGLYTIVESVSKPFLKQRLGEESGTLYDYEYAFEYYFATRGNDRSAYSPIPFEPQTNENKYDDGLAEFVKAVNDASDANVVSTIASYLDVDKFIAYLATENALAEYDGFVGYAGMNNFYLYQYGGQKKFFFIPWDKDTSFTQPDWPLYIRIDTNVLTRRLLADPAQRQKYANEVKRAVNNYVNSAYLGPKLEQAYTQIREAAIADTKKPFNNTEFELSIAGLRGIIAGRQADVAAQAP